jgi:hypothetical protein
VTGPLISVVIAAHGDRRWEQMAKERALPSTSGQDAQAFVYYEPDGTLASARNNGAACATGEWLCFLDADDELAPGFCNTMRNTIQALNEGEHLLTPAVRYVPRGRNAVSVPAKIWPRVDLRQGNWLVIGTLLRKRLFDQVGGFREWPMYEDWCLWQRCATAGAIPVEVPDAVYVAHMSMGSRNRAPGRKAREDTHYAIQRANHPELFATEGSDGAR